MTFLPPFAAAGGEGGPVWRALLPGTLGRGRKSDTPFPVTHLHFSGETGAKPLVEDLRLHWGFLGSRAAPLLWSIENQPWTQRFEKEKRN